MREVIFLLILSQEMFNHFMKEIWGKKCLSPKYKVDVFSYIPEVMTFFKTGAQFTG